jgi:hypothetical protein
MTMLARMSRDGHLRAEQGEGVQSNLGTMHQCYEAQAS